MDSACRLLRLPSIRNEFSDIAEGALKDQMSYRGFPAELLMAECDDRARRRPERRIKAVGFPREKFLRIPGVRLCPSGTSVTVGFTRFRGRWRCAIRGGPTASVTSAAWNGASAENRVG